MPVHWLEIFIYQQFLIILSIQFLISYWLNIFVLNALINRMSSFYWFQTVICSLIVLHYFSLYDTSMNSAMIIMGAYGGYLIIPVGILFGIIMGSSIDRRIVSNI